MTGRKPFFGIAVLMLVGALLHWSLPMLLWWTGRPQSLGVHDVRVLDNLPKASGASPDTQLELEAGETLTLPDGKRLKLLALQFLPQHLKGAGDAIPVEGVYCDLQGKWITGDEAVELNRRMMQYPDPRFVRNGFLNNGVGWEVSVIGMTDIPFGRIKLGLFDSETGGPPQTWKGMGYSWFCKPVDGLGTLAQVSFPYDGVRPTPMVLRLEVKYGEETEIQLKPNPGESFTWQGKAYTLQSIAPRVLPNRPGNPQDPYGLGPGFAPMAYTFSALPAEMQSIVPYDKAGVKLPYTGLTDELWEFAGPVEHINIRLMPSAIKVTMKLPPFPVVPEGNRHTTDVSAMILPPTVVSNQMDWDGLLSLLLQAEYKSYYGTVQPKSELAFPLDVGGKTVGEVLAIESARFPPNELVLVPKPVAMRTDRVARGTTANRQYPGAIVFLKSVARCAPGVLALAGLLSVWKTILLVAAASLRRALRPHGYGDLALWQAEFLAAKLRRRAWKLPARDELAALPGVDLEDLRTVVALMRRKAG